VEKKMSTSCLLGMTESSSLEPAKVQNPLLLAYLGDAVYELYVRYHLLAKGIVRPQDLQKEATKYVAAVAQARVYRQIESTLAEAERDIVRRGRNAKSGSVPKNTKVSDYRYSTGIEALIGHLYLSNDPYRLTQLMQLILEETDKGENTGE
jgi:ribonuclease III family protein